MVLKLLFYKIQKENTEEINIIEVILHKNNIYKVVIKESQNIEILKLACYLLEPALH